MKKLLLALLVLIVSAPSIAQTHSSSLFSNDEDSHIILSGESDYYYVHRIEKGQSLYALAKTFNVPLSYLYSVNRLQEGATIGIGQEIKVPIKDKYLFKGTDLKGLKYGHYIPVYYQTKPKDNLFRISRIYFNQSTEDLMKRNHLTNNNLSLGQNILVGWFPIDAVSPSQISEDNSDEQVVEVNEPSTQESLNESLGDGYSLLVTSKEEIETDVEATEINEPDSLAVESILPEGFDENLLGRLHYKENMQQISRSEVAHWDKAMPDNGTMYVLHKTALIDSYMELFNPNLNRTVLAKVIGRIPYGAYTNNVNLVLSPRTAKQLGALDNRFRVRVKALIVKQENESDE